MRNHEDLHMFLRTEPAYNREDSTSENQYSLAETRYFREGSGLVYALAGMLYLQGLEPEAGETTFNPWILNQRLAEAGAFSATGNLSLSLLYRLYPLVYHGDIPYARESLQFLLGKEISCLLLFAREHEYGRFLAVIDLTEEDVLVFDPSAGVRFLSEFDEVCEIRVFLRNRVPALHIESSLQPGEDPDRFVFLVNSEHTLPETCEPEDIVFLDALKDRHYHHQYDPMFLNRTAETAMEQMSAYVGKDGFFRIVIEDAGRTRSIQQQIYENDTEGYVAKPGASEHQTGLAVDVLDNDPVKTPLLWEYLAEICCLFGFVMRYPQGKENITKIPFEPWHFRYVGPKAACAMRENGWVLEEYMFHRHLAEPPKPAIALTFDDGPAPGSTDRILDALEQAGARATFFVVGNRVADHAERLRRMKRDGHQIGCHTWNHEYISEISRSELKASLQKTNDAVLKACGTLPEIMRPPGEKHSEDSLKTVGETGMPAVLWSVDPRDWERRNTQFIIDYVLRHVQGGDIVLLHDLYHTTAAAAEYLIPELIRRGFSLLTIKELSDRTGGMMPGRRYYHF
ncbi:MAG: polysaccharide deacetylase family protein [Eubacteriales bacterium]|nr:polysaccharide deacetylase family protein [Eubacteriales bacterium]